MPTIAVVGAGPGLGLAIARAFGSHGYDVALIARNPEKLRSLVDALSADGISAAAFPADVRDQPALSRALDDAAARFGAIDVLEFSPVAKGEGETTLATPSTANRENLQAAIDSQLFGAVAAAAAVLPAMRDAGAGTLLFTTGAGSLDPVPMIANVNAAAAALRNWAINLHKELASSGVYAAHVGIDVSIDVAQIPGFPVAPASEIAAAYWDLHTAREVSEFVFRAK